MKINLTSIHKHILNHIKNYYSLEERPEIKELGPVWVKDMLRKHVWYAITQHELKTLDFINIVDFNESSCLNKYKIIKKLDTHYVLEGNKIAKINLISLWHYKYKDELQDTINAEFQMCKNAHSKGLGPRIYDAFICFNADQKCAYKVIVTEYINNSCTLEEWLEKKHSPEEKKYVYDLVKKQIDIMNDNGIIYKNLWTCNIILKFKNKKVDRVIITDFDQAYDSSIKKTQMNDLWVLNQIKHESYNHADDVLNYVVSSLISKKQITIV
jgi:tRNA A-37 threonylcarbamoyl transferase component Bud32